MSIQEYERDLKEDIKLNRFALEKEAERQADMYLFWSMELSEAKFKRDKAKTRLTITEGERELEIRKDPDYDGKITESVIKALIAKDSEVIDAQEKLVKSQKVVNDLEAVCQALEHKRSQIKHLTELSISGYYASPDQGGRDTESANSARKGLNKKGKEDG